MSVRHEVDLEHAYDFFLELRGKHDLENKRLVKNQPWSVYHALKKAYSIGSDIPSHTEHGIACLRASVALLSEARNTIEDQKKIAGNKEREDWAILDRLVLRAIGSCQDMIVDLEGNTRDACPQCER